MASSFLFTPFLSLSFSLSLSCSSFLKSFRLGVFLAHSLISLCHLPQIIQGFHHPFSEYFSASSLLSIIYDSEKTSACSSCLLPAIKDLSLKQPLQSLEGEKDSLQALFNKASDWTIWGPPWPSFGKPCCAAPIQYVLMVIQCFQIDP